MAPTREGECLVTSWKKTIEQIISGLWLLHQDIPDFSNLDGDAAT